MNKTETLKIKHAIKELMDGDFAKGVAVLAKLVGMQYPAGEIETNKMTIIDALSGNKIRQK